MSNDLYFDTNTFDFTSLVDVVETGANEPVKHTAKISEIGPDGGSVDDISDLSDLFSATDEDEATDTDPNNDVSDLLTDEVDPDTITLFNDLPDDAPLDILGEPMTKAQIKELKQAKEVFENQKELVSTAANSIDQIHKFIMQDYAKHKTVFDMQREDMQRELGTNINNIRRGEIALKMQSLQEAENYLVTRTQDKMKLLDAERVETTKFRIAQTDHALQSEIPQWNQLKGGLLQEIRNIGGDQLLNDLEKVWNPHIAKMALDAYRYRKGREKVGAAALEAAKAKAPRSTSTAANAQRQQTLDATTAKKAALIKKARQGNLSKAEHSEMFNFLVD